MITFWLIAGIVALIAVMLFSGGKIFAPLNPSGYTYPSSTGA